MPGRKERVAGVVRGAKASLNAAANTVRSKTSRNARKRIAAKDAEIAALRRELSRARGSERPTDVEAGGTPVFFVVGQQKSGTTWLMRTLDAHPEILCRGEGRFFGGDWKQKSLVRQNVQRPPSSLLYAMRDAQYLRHWIERSVWSRNDPADEHLDNLTRMAVDYFLEGELLKSGKRMVGDKSPLLTPETIEEIASIYPDAKVIHIVRDGRDAAVSAAHHSRNFGKSTRNPRKPAGRNGSIFEEEGLRKLAADWNARVGKTVEDGPKLLGDNYTEVRYEDLLERPSEEVGRLLRFLGADDGEEVVRRCVESASFERLSRGRKRGEEDATSFFRKGVAGDWKSVFTERDRKVFEELAGNLLVRLGYEKSDNG